MTLTDYNLSVEDLSRMLGYTPQRVRALAASGKLPALKRFRQWMFCEKEVFESIKQMSVQPVAASDKTELGDNDRNNGRRSTDNPASDLLS